MSSWTIRPRGVPMIRQGQKQTHPAALQAVRYVRRHAWQFHGAGVMDAVAQLEAVTGTRVLRGQVSAREARAARLLAAFELPEETAHGLTVVGWRGENGLARCLEHRSIGSTPLTAADLEAVGTVLCVKCGGKLSGPRVTPAECPDCSHPHVQGQMCRSEMGVGFCGCTG